MLPGSSAGGASRSASICSSWASLSLRPRAVKSFTPLYSGGLCDAEMTTPASSASSATAGVGSTPASTAVPPAATTPPANPPSSPAPEPRAARPARHGAAQALHELDGQRLADDAADAVRAEVPPQRRRRLALGELRRLAGLVQAGLLALDHAGVARQEALALEHDTQLRIGLDERAGDAVPDGARLPGRPAAVHAHTEVVASLEPGDLERRHDGRPVRHTREVLLGGAAVHPRGAVAGPQDHTRHRCLALAGAEVLRDLGHLLVDLQRLRRLRLVRVLRPGVDLQLAELRTAEAVARKHALDRLADDLGGAAVELVAQRPRPEPARGAGVAGGRSAGCGSCRGREVS